MSTSQVAKINKSTISDETALHRNTANPKFAPRGVYALIPWGKTPEPETWRNPCIDGITIRAYWKEFNPHPNEYNWSKLERIFAKADSFSKKIQLIIAPGFYSPQWVLDRLKESEKDSFFVPHGTLHGKKLPLPLPWGSTYLDCWFTFVDALGKKFGADPNLSIINITGPNSHSGEVSLPNKGKHGNSMDEWKNLVLENWKNLPNGAERAEQKLKDTLVTAYKMTFNRFYKAFVVTHEKYVSLQLFNQSLPVPSAGRYPSAIQKEYQSELITLARDKFDKFFVLMNGGLEAWPIADQVSKLYPPPEEPMQWKRIRRLSNEGFVTGLLQKDAVDESDVKDANIKTNERELFRLIIKNGIYFGASFLVIFEKDIHDNSFKDLIAAGSILLQGKCTCQ